MRTPEKGPLVGLRLTGAMGDIAIVVLEDHGMRVVKEVEKLREIIWAGRVD